MSRFILVCLVAATVMVVLFCPVDIVAQEETSTPPPVTPPRPKTITIASYNLYNMFDVYDDPYSDDEGTRVKPRAEIEKVAQALQAINADVIAVQEVENEGILKAMVQTMLGGMKYNTVIVNPTNSGRGGNIGLISRYPILSVTSHRWRDFGLEGEDETWRFMRDLLRARIKVKEGFVFDLFVVHFKSKRTVPGDTEARKWRLAEATAARKVIASFLKEKPGALVCVAGDCNDDPDSPALKALLANNVLTDLHMNLPRDQRITFRSKRYGDNTLDYIFASPKLLKRKVKDSARVISAPPLTDGSDHLPIVVQFRID